VPLIHATAQVHSRAELADDVQVGAWTIIGPTAKIGRGTIIGSNCVIEGATTIGEGNKIAPFAVIGTTPQDIGYRGEATRVQIGNNNSIREFVTINRGTIKDRGITTIGSGTLLMAYCHIAHDCDVGDNVIMANGVQLGGHVKVEQDVVFGGLAAIHHFATIGQKAFVGGMTRIVHDAPPFMTVEGNPARVRCVNSVGLKRKGFSDERIRIIKDAYKLLYRSGLSKGQAADKLMSESGDNPDLVALVDFLRAAEAGKQGRAREAFRKVPA
jgi:UDP-N-acetylglucosamine acyltransferase